jgi:hypothetical protein
MGNWARSLGLLHFECVHGVCKLLANKPCAQTLARSLFLRFDLNQPLRFGFFQPLRNRP